MTVSDPIADLLTRVRNALKAEHRYTEAPWSKFKESIASILKNEGFIENFKVLETDGLKSLRLYLKYTSGRKPVIKGLKRVSKPGLRKYIQHNDIPKFYGNLGLAIVSTSAGVLSGNDAHQKKIGGELVCLVW